MLEFALVSFQLAVQSDQSLSLLHAFVITTTIKALGVVGVTRAITCDLRTLLRAWVVVGTSAVHAPVTAIPAIVETVCTTFDVTPRPVVTVPPQAKTAVEFECVTAVLAACARLASVLIERVDELQGDTRASK